MSLYPEEFGKKFIQVYKDRLIPDFIRQYYPEFSNVVEAWLESYDKSEQAEEDIQDRYGAYSLLIRIHELIDIDKTDEEFLTLFITQYLFSTQPVILELMDVRMLIRNSKRLWAEKGKLSAFRFLFYLVDSSIVITEPQPLIWKASEKGHLLSGAAIGDDPDYESKRLHDNIFYTHYVYGVNTSVSPDTTRELLYKYLHPVGFSLYLDYYDFANDGFPLEWTWTAYDSELGIPIDLALLLNPSTVLSQLVSETVFHIVYTLGTSFLSYDPTYDEIWDKTVDTEFYAIEDFGHVPIQDFADKADELFRWKPKAEVVIVPP